ncbi:MAG: DUF4129 domain-containing protein [Candidatus Methanofastidiosia archaeon]|jgi:hypothetical protein
MRISSLILCIIVAFCIGTLATIIGMGTAPPVGPAEKDIPAHIQYFNPYFPLIITVWVLIIIVGFSKTRIRNSPLLPSDNDWRGILGLALGLIFILLVIWKLINKAKDLQFTLNREMILSLFNPFKKPLVVRTPTTIEKVFIFVGAFIIILVIVMIILAFISMSRKKISSHKSYFDRMGEDRRRKKPYIFEGSPREVVINAYGASRDHLHGRGYRYKKDKTPAEFTKDVENENLNSLTDLFEEARYSNHDITTKYSKSALSYYRRLKDEY